MLNILEILNWNVHRILRLPLYRRCAVIEIFVELLKTIRRVYFDFVRTIGVLINLHWHLKHEQIVIYFLVKNQYNNFPLKIYQNPLNWISFGAYNRLWVRIQLRLIGTFATFRLQRWRTRGAKFMDIFHGTRGSEFQFQTFRTTTDVNAELTLKKNHKKRAISFFTAVFIEHL